MAELPRRSGTAFLSGICCWYAPPSSCRCTCWAATWWECGMRNGYTLCRRAVFFIVLRLKWVSSTAFGYLVASDRTGKNENVEKKRGREKERERKKRGGGREVTFYRFTEASRTTALIDHTYTPQNWAFTGPSAASAHRARLVYPRTLPVYTWLPCCCHLVVCCV